MTRVPGTRATGSLIWLIMRQSVLKTRMGTRVRALLHVWTEALRRARAEVLMKTLPLGQQAAQRMTSELSPSLQLAQLHASHLDVSHMGSAAFGLSLARMAHERQYSRLFRS